MVVGTSDSRHGVTVRLDGRFGGLGYTYLCAFDMGYDNTENDDEDEGEETSRNQKKGGPRFSIKSKCELMTRGFTFILRFREIAKSPLKVN